MTASHAHLITGRVVPQKLGKQPAPQFQTWLSWPCARSGARLVDAKTGVVDAKNRVVDTKRRNG
eukprot:8876638-Pyramimonas_sp.AAC.1